MGVIYSKSAGLNDAKLGKLTSALRTVIEFESDIKAKDDVLSAIYNIAKSNKWGETIQYQDEFGEFQYTAEGTAAKQDSMGDTYRKLIEHIPFMKEFEITKEMLDDANYGVSADATRRAQAFMRAYKNTRTKLGILALANGTGASFTFNGATVDTKCADDLSLFNKAHKYGRTDANTVPARTAGTQSNYLYAKKAGAALALEEVVDMIEAGAQQIRNMKDENGEVLGYTADTIIIPGNQRVLERYVKQALGSEFSPADNTNAINIQCGNWNLIVLPQWQIASGTAEDHMIIMSSEANKNLSGNMFFNRVDLEMADEMDIHTHDWIWSGYCRFGVGFGTYKHIVRVKSIASGATAPTDATAI